MTKKQGSRVSIKQMAKSRQDQIHQKFAAYLKHTFLVVSSKGGVGKTSVALNLALGFSKKGFKIGLLDLDIYGSDIHRMLGVDRPFEPDAKKRFTPWVYSDNLKVAAGEHALQKTQ